jgi:hypothetical protein
MDESRCQDCPDCGWERWSSWCWAVHLNDGHLDPALEVEPKRVGGDRTSGDKNE